MAITLRGLIREEIYGVLLNEGLMFLARQYETLLYDPKAEDFMDRIDYLEIHNDIDWVQVYELPDLDHVFDHPGKLKELKENAMAYLQERFPELLICSDRSISFMEPTYGYDYQITKRFADGFARNEQIIDHHFYAGGLQYRFF